MTSISNLGSERPHLGSERPHLGSVRPHLGSERPHLGSERPYVASERLDLGSGSLFRRGGDRKQKMETGNCSALCGIIGHLPLWGRCLKTVKPITNFDQNR